MKRDDFEKFRFFAVLAFVALADQVLKLLYLAFPFEFEASALGIRLLGFHLIRNTGAAFGILKGQALILSAISIAFIAAAIYKLKEIKKEGLDIPVALICGGALGNLIDRLIRGFVVDFVSILNIPYFNLADASITVGVVLAAAMVIRKEAERKKAKQGINLKENKNI